MLLLERSAVDDIEAGFEPFEQTGIAIAAGKPESVNITLSIAIQKEKVEVQDSGTQLDVSGSSNASSVVLRGKDLDALSDDPDDLQVSDGLERLERLATGPAVEERPAERRPKGAVHRDVGGADSTCGRAGAGTTYRTRGRA